jgi:hypothetical protein
MAVLPAVLLMLLGIAVGAFGTLVGAGGGFVLTPLLLLLYPEERPEVITSISLAVVFFNALSGSIAYGRMKRIDYPTGRLFALATVPGGFLGALATRLFTRGLFDILFGSILILLAAYIIVRRQAEQRVLAESRSGWTHRLVVDAFGHQHEYSFDRKLGLAISFVVGFLSSLLGIGGGVVHVPALVQLLNFPTHIATATSHFILVITSLTGTLVHIAAGDFSRGIRRTIFLGAGVIIGAQVGARLANRVHGLLIIRLLALGLASVGLRLVLHGAGII